VAVVWAQNCSFQEKAVLAKAAGAKGIVVVSANATVNMTAENATVDSEDLGLFVLGVAKAVGDRFAAADAYAERHGVGEDGPLRLAFTVYTPPSLINDPSEFLVICLATSLLVAGAFFSTADLRLGSPIAPKSSEQVVEVDTWFPLMFCALGSCVLVTLYFLMQYLIYFIIFMFCVGGASTLTELAHVNLRYYLPTLQRRLCSAPLVGLIEVAHVLASAAAAFVVVSWLVLRNTEHGWLFQDIIGAGFLCFMQRTLRMPNMKLAAGLLSLMFCFDVFWVFLSPLIFEKSVMVVVATGGGTGESVPMLLRIPPIGDPLGRDRMLGFGDIALPGLLISFLLRFDILSRRRMTQGYFVPAVVGYTIALCTTLLALYIMQMGQPALLYLVPGTLGTTLVLGWKRGELMNLWEGEPIASGSSTPAGLGSACNYCPSGHALQPMAAEAGSCDGCKKPVHAGQQVMDCRQCNWYLCQACRPLTPAAPPAAPSEVQVRELDGALLPAASAV